MQSHCPFKDFNSRIFKNKPSFLGGGVLVAILGLGVVGVLSPYEYNILPALPILESFVLLLTVLVFPPKSRGALLFMMAVGAYLTVTFAISVSVSSAHVLDYLQAYKAFFYIGMLCCYLDSPLFGKQQIVGFFYLLLCLFLVKYGYSRLIDLDVWVSKRPGVYTENNFELVFLVLLLYLVVLDIRWRVLCFVAVVLVIFLSGSRSAFLCMLVVCLFSVFKLGRGFANRWLLLFPLLIIAGFGIVSERIDVSIGGLMSGSAVTENGASVTKTQPESDVVQDDEDAVQISKDEGLRSLLERGASIDRVQFLLYFLDEVEGWHWWNILLGTQPLTPLSTETCEALSYWSDMYSFSGDGSCYSVILHSYIIRVIFDHGVLGLVFLLTFTVYALRKSGYNILDVFCVLGVLLATSLSVSAFNSVFVMLSMMLYLSRKRG